MAGRDVDPLDAKAARLAALNSLARRDHAAADLERKLLQKGYDSSVVTQLLALLRAEKLLDDRSFADNFIAYHAARGEGPLRVSALLRQKGLEKEVIDTAIAGYCDWATQLRKLKHKKFGAAVPVNYADRQRQARFFGYRGFTSAQIRAVLGFDVDLDANIEEL